MSSPLCLCLWFSFWSVWAWEVERSVLENFQAFLSLWRLSCSHDLCLQQALHLIHGPWMFVQVHRAPQYLGTLFLLSDLACSMAWGRRGVLVSIFAELLVNQTSSPACPVRSCGSNCIDSWISCRSCPPRPCALQHIENFFQDTNNKI